MERMDIYLYINQSPVSVVYNYTALENCNVTDFTINHEMA